jgi:hypothetical protein
VGWLVTEIGKPIYFDVKKHADAIVQMIQADEIQIALQMLEQVPGYYRDHYPPELAEIRAKIYEQTYDQIEYATDDEEASCTREFGEAQWDNGYMFPRAEVVSKLVRGLNDKDLVPWIFDLGCSHGNLPLGLIREGLRFSYKGSGMNFRIQEKVKAWVGERWLDRPRKDQLTVLYNTEVIEHCFNPHDIVHSAYKVGVKWDYIVLSVPMYTLGGGLPDWDTRRMGHVRTWTPKEFHAFADKAWPGYTWELTIAPSMVLKGVRK